MFQTENNPYQNETIDIDDLGLLQDVRVEESEVLSILTTLDVTKSPGIDNISPDLCHATA